LPFTDVGRILSGDECRFNGMETTTVTPPARERTWEQQSADDSLSAYPHRLEMRGSPQSMKWPDVCANCGAGSSERILVRKAFYRHGRGRHYHNSLGYRVVSIDLPFCGACAARHRETLPHMSFLQRYRTFLLNPAHIATIGSAVVLWMTLPAVKEVPTDRTAAMIAWGLPALFVFGIVWTVGLTWMTSRPDRFEPRTETSLACDVSHDVGEFFGGQRYVYGFRNRSFADAFERANQNRLWTGRDQKRMLKRSGILAVLFIGGLIVARLLLWYYEGR
jgi:hypothetical protein